MQSRSTGYGRFGQFGSVVQRQVNGSNIQVSSAQLIYHLPSWSQPISTNANPISCSTRPRIWSLGGDYSLGRRYSLDARSSPSLQEARHKPGAWLEGRSSLRILSSAKLAETTRAQQRHKRHPLRLRQARNKRQLHRAGLLLDPDWLGSELQLEPGSMSLMAHKNSWLPEKFRVPILDSSPASSATVAILKIESLTSEDNGSYSCRVDFRKARSQTQEWQLRVVSKYPGYLECC